MNDLEAAYIAGLFDGEGTVAVTPYRASKNGARYNRVVLRITNTHRPVLDWLVHTVGAGSVAADKRKVGHYKPCFRYYLQNAKAAALLKTIRPHLKIKADQVDAILAGRISGRV